MTNLQLKQIAREIFEIEAREIANLAYKLTDDFEKAIEAILKSKGKVIISGIGKSGLIGKKISATLSSTGTSSFFLHSSEAYHGDLGMVEKDDIVLLISNSGETDEVLKIVPFFKTQGNITISITGNPNSTLAKNTDYHLNISVEREGCPLNLAPMASTTAMLVMGDAIASTLMRVKNFKKEDFARYHPGGSLGRRLLTKVKDIAYMDNLPTSSIDDNIKDVIKVISKSRFGLTAVMDNSQIVGVITDGDLRRAMEDEENFFKLKARDIMTEKAKTIDLEEKLIDAQKMMLNYKINSLLVTENGRFVGVIQLYDLGI